MFIMGDIFIHQQQSGFAHFTGDLNDHFYAHTIEAEYYKLVRAKQTKCNVTWRTVTLIPWSVSYTRSQQSSSTTLQTILLYQPT